MSVGGRITLSRRDSTPFLVQPPLTFTLLIQRGAADLCGRGGAFTGPAEAKTADGLWAFTPRSEASFVSPRPPPRDQCGPILPLKQHDDGSPGWLL